MMPGAKGFTGHDVDGTRQKTDVPFDLGSSWALRGPKYEGHDTSRAQTHTNNRCGNVSILTVIVWHDVGTFAVGEAVVIDGQLVRLKV